MANFGKAKFKYLTTFEEFGWILYLTTQHLVHENLLWVFFSNATLESTREEDEDPFQIVVINTFLIGMTIAVTQGDVAMAFDISDGGLSDKHVGFPMSILIQHDNALDLHLHERLQYARLITGLCTMSRLATRSICPPWSFRTWLRSYKATSRPSHMACI